MDHMDYQPFTESNHFSNICNLSYRPLELDLVPLAHVPWDPEKSLGAWG